MKKRFVVVAAAVLVGGSLMVGIQAGSTGVPGIGAAGSGRAGLAAAPAFVPVTAVAVIALPGRVATLRPAAVQDMAVVDDAAGEESAPAEVAMAGASLEPMAIGFDGVLAQPQGYDGAALRMPTVEMIELAPVGNTGLLGRNALGPQALSQPQAVSAVPEPATWISFIVGLGLVGFNLRRRMGLRSVAS
jgi:hypothetical protein